MDVFASILWAGLAFPVVVFLFFLWVLACNDRTWREREKMIDKIYKQPGWSAYSKMFGQRSYHQHVWDRILLKNPMKRYPEPLQELMDD